MLKGYFLTLNMICVLAGNLMIDKKYWSARVSVDTL